MAFFKVQLLSMILLLAALGHAQAPGSLTVSRRIYESPQGNININKIEQAAAAQLGQAVVVEEFRWPYNPAQYFVSTATAASIAFYTIKMTVAQQLKASCTFEITWWNTKARIHSCTSNGNDFSGKDLGIVVNLRYSDFMERENN